MNSGKLRVLGANIHKSQKLGKVVIKNRDKYRVVREKESVDSSVVSWGGGPTGKGTALASRFNDFQAIAVKSFDSSKLPEIGGNYTDRSGK